MNKGGRTAWHFHISGDVGKPEDDKITLIRTDRGRLIELEIVAPGLWETRPQSDQIRLARNEIRIALNELLKTTHSAKLHGETVVLALDRAGKRIRLEIDAPGLQSAATDQNLRIRRKIQSALADVRRALESPSALPGLHGP